MLEIFVTIVLLFSAFFLVSVWHENFFKSQKNLPPGPLRLPFFGNLLQIAWINSKEPYLAFSKLGEKYGNIVSVKMGSVNAVLLNSFDVIEEYLTKPEFTDRYFNDWIGERTFQQRLGVGFSKYPLPWTELRSFSHRTLREFGFGKRSIMQSIIHAEITDIVSELKSSILETNGIHTFDDYFTISVLNVLWSMLAGTRYEHSDPKLLRLMKVTKAFLTSCNFVNNILVVFPEWRNWFPDWTGMSTQRKCFRETNAFFQEFIEERKQLGIYKTSPENFVDEFLREIDANIGNNNSNFTEQQLVAIMSDFFLAGSEATSNTLAWNILYLLLNPNVQAKLQKEIDSVVPKGTLPNSEHESQLHYVRATIAETHRMASLLPMNLPRATTENVMCGNFFVPEGTYVIANLFGVHHDKNYWKDPESFKPERFLNEAGEFKTDPRLKPFGLGKRSCIGESLASMNLIQYLTVLLQHFRFKPVPNEPLPSVSPVVGITNAPQKFRALIECRLD